MRSRGMRGGEIVVLKKDSFHDGGVSTRLFKYEDEGKVIEVLLDLHLQEENKGSIEINSTVQEAQIIIGNDVELYKTISGTNVLTLKKIDSIKVDVDFDNNTITIISIIPSGGRSVRKSLYIKTGEKHKCVDGKWRMLWHKGNNMYVRVKSKITGKLGYKKVNV